MKTDSPNSLFKAAIKAGRDRDYSKAINLLQDLLCRTDQIPGALLYLGRSYHALGDFNRAVQALQYFLKVKTDSPEGHFFIGRSFLSLGLTKQALRHLKKSTDLNSDFSPGLSLLGLTLLKSGRPRMAIHYFEKALKIDPQHPRIFNGYLNALLTYAIRLFHREKYSESAEMFKFILEHRKNSLISHLYLASIYRETGDHYQSLHYFKQASLLSPDDPVLFLQKAVSYLLQGENDSALDEMHQAMKMLGRSSLKLSDPESLLRLMTLILFQNKRYREAINCGHRVLKKSYHDIEIRSIMAECFRNLGDLVKAKNHYLRALDQDKHRLTLNYGLAAVLWQNEEFNELLQILNRIRKIKPDDEFSPYYLALALPHLEESFEKTIPILQEQIRKLGPDPHLMSTLGGEYRKADLPHLAEGWFLRTLKQNESHKESLYSLIKIYKELNKQEEIKKAYKKYLEYYPEDHSLRREFIRFLFEGENFKQASLEIVKLLPHEPNNLTLKKMLAVSYRKLKKYPEAIILFRELLRENPKSEEFLRALIYCLSETNRKQAAINLLEKAQRVFIDSVSILLPLGVLYVKENNLEKAAETFRKVISIAPGEWKAHRNLAIIYEKTGKHIFAEKFFKRAETLKQGIKP